MVLGDREMLVLKHSSGTCREALQLDIKMNLCSEE